MSSTPPENTPEPGAPPSPAAAAGSAGTPWLLVLGLLLLAVGVAFEPASAQDDGGGSGGGNQTRAVPTIASGGTSDSNNTMIAVTGVDVTGQSILYLVDTVGKQICVYQANGGSSSTQGVKFVGARRIELDLLLDGFNDKTESDGRALSYKDLQRAFEAQGQSTDDR